MQLLRERILAEGRNLGGGILKVDTFINHQVDAQLMMAAGEELARRFRPLGASKVLTAEISGIAPALTTAVALGVPAVYARKVRPVTMPAAAYREAAPSHTKGRVAELFVSPEVILPSDRILVVDDFMASGQTIAALIRIVKQCGAALVGIGALIEKSFEGGRSNLRQEGVPIEALVTIRSMEAGHIEFADQP